MDYWVFVWLGVLAISLIVEFVTFELVSVWIALGALVSLILALIGGIGYEIQIIICVAVSVASILGLRKVTLKFLTKGKETTNIDSAIGQTVKLITRTDDDEVGSAKYNGVIWSIKEENDGTIEAGEYADIVRVQGNKLIVKKSHHHKSAPKVEKKEDPKEVVAEEPKEELAQEQKKEKKSKPSK